MSRNADFLYVGGTLQQARSSLFFAKLDALAQNIVATTLLSTVADFTVRRVIRENNKAYSGTNDNTKLYFCGFTSANSGDMIYGYLTSNDLTSLSISIIFQYGSTGTEFTFTSSTMLPFSSGDCALTEDNSYMIGLFSTAF